MGTGTKEENIYVVLYWDSGKGYTTELHRTKDMAEICRGYGNFAGYRRITTVIPKQSDDLAQA